MLLGADTIRPLLRRLVPEAEFLSRPRFSTLRYVGPKKATRLPPRSAVVAFAVADVFALAELMRRQSGGTAVVLGALSPRARNAQVGLFQSGEVDYLVATDAIGMGLNMDLDHVAFARVVKYDGHAPRRLSPAEIAQIAGRAGRHMSDGTFGTTADLEGLEPEIVEAVENHRFDPLEALFWRASKLDFRSPQQLMASLEARPVTRGLTLAPEADDHRTLRALARMPDVVDSATNPAMVRLLWEVCQIPDFRKVMSETHARLLARIYRHLASIEARLPTDWVADQVSRLDRTDGDIDTLMSRIAHVRTWTYVAHRPDWLANSAHWQERARAIEDKLSDALHDRITQRFVDRRSALLVRRLREPGDLLASVSRDGDVKVEGHFVGRLDGFRFVPDEAAAIDGQRTLLAAANRVLRGEIAGRARSLAEAQDAELSLTQDGFIAWRGGAVGRLAAGESALSPRVEALPGDFLEGHLREAVRQRIAAFVATSLERGLAALHHARSAALDGPARGLVYQLAEALGSMPARAVAPLVSSLGKGDRTALARLGVRLGTESVFLLPLLKPACVRLRAMLWAVRQGAALPRAPRGNAAARDPAIGDDAYWAMGYRVLGARVLRVDRLEQLAAAARKLARQGPFAATPALASLAGADAAGLAMILPSLGYRAVHENGAVTFHAHGVRRRRERVRGVAADGPFAKLKELRLAR